MLNYFSLVAVIALSVFALNPLCPNAIFLYFHLFPTSLLAHIFQGLILTYPSIVCLEQPLGLVPLMLRKITRFLIPLSPYTWPVCPFFLFASDKCFCVGLSIESYYLLYFYYYRYWFIFCIRQIVLFII